MSLDVGMSISCDVDESMMKDVKSTWWCFFHLVSLGLDRVAKADYGVGPDKVLEKLVRRWSTLYAALLKDQYIATLFQSQYT